MASRVWFGSYNIGGILLGPSPTFGTRVLKGFRHCYSSHASRVLSLCSTHEEQLLSSPELVSLEYADLNLPLPDKVNLFLTFFPYFFEKLKLWVFSVRAGTWSC